MTLKDLKTSLETKTYKKESIIFIAEDKFIPLQYIEEIRKLGYELVYKENIESLIASSNDIFKNTEKIKEDNLIYIIITDTLSYFEDIDDSVIIVTKKVEKSIKTTYADIIIEIPSLEDWQIKDMVYSYCKGVEPKHLDWLIKCCNSDVNRLYQECLKLKLFKETERAFLFNEMLKENAFEDLASNTIFNLTNALLKKDIHKLSEIYSEIDNIDINEFGLLTILYNNFLNVVNIQLGINPTPEKLNLKPNQFNAIKYNCGYYNKEQLLKILKFLGNIDLKVKAGELPVSIMRDYIILKILTI